MAESIVYMILVGAGGLMTIVAGTYALAYLADRICSSPYATERIFSPVANKAGLWGMGQKERSIVLEQVFSKTIQKFDKSTIINVSAMEKKLPMEIEMTDLKSTNHKQDNNHGSGPTENETDVEIGASANAHVEERGPEQPTNMCSICLAEFEEGDQVMTGTLCAHLYHFKCIMEWMQKGHDHCPFCRENMMSATEMRSAALHVLGSKRVEQLTRPDLEAQLESFALPPASPNDVVDVDALRTTNHRTQPGEEDLAAGHQPESNDVGESPADLHTINTPDPEDKPEAHGKAGTFDRPEPACLQQEDDVESVAKQSAEETTVAKARRSEEGDFSAEHTV